MDTQDIILAGLAASGSDAEFTPVQAQKLFFLMDREIAESQGWPRFNFVPYAYGPFDKAVYSAMEHLARSDLVVIDRSPHRRWNIYRLTSAGFDRGAEILHDLDETVAAYIKTLSTWVRSQSFPKLVSAIYRKYPDMKINSVFQG